MTRKIDSQLAQLLSQAVGQSVNIRPFQHRQKDEHQRLKITTIKSTIWQTPSSSVLLRTWKYTFISSSVCRGMPPIIILACIKHPNRLGRDCPPPTQADYSRPSSDHLSRNGRRAQLAENVTQSQMIVVSNLSDIRYAQLMRSNKTEIRILCSYYRRSTTIGQFKSAPRDTKNR